MTTPIDPLDFGVDLEEVRQRAQALGYFVSVTDILDATEALDAERGIPASPPAAFVAVSSERAGSNDLIQGFAQRVEVEISILFVESATRFDRKSRDQLERTRKAIIRQFVAWTPRNTQRGLEYRRYRVISIGNGLAWGEVTFGAVYRLSAST